MFNLVKISSNFYDLSNLKANSELIEILINPICKFCYISEDNIIVNITIPIIIEQ